MNEIQLPLIITYILMTVYFLINWLIFLGKNPTSTPEEKFLSLIMLIITTVLWPLGIVTVCGEIFQKRQVQFQQIIPLFLGIIIFSVSCYLQQFLTF
ncbi:hypothetical protein H6F32_04790 [Anabaena sp. FACHB-1237]|uniref:hypothetical protein n=1 Tax=Anabaena sp. FACHB-1237 TaxID=2692769 RepID=UPI001680E7DD|nr:hypothetical protein [Anabaena sp. FACHB-1237]MBD2136919.1 hypothetical protein [Anabaena sp. FACHB-1237]